jgi:hypothetical protein
MRAGTCQRPSLTYLPPCCSTNRATIRFDDLNWTTGYKPIPAYGQSKLADLLMSQHLADLAARKGWPLLSTGAHPGSARTNIAANGPTMGGRPPLLLQILGRIVPSQSAADGAQPLLYAATSSHPVAAHAP